MPTFDDVISYQYSSNNLDDEDLLLKNKVNNDDDAEVHEKVVKINYELQEVRISIY